MHDLDPTFSGAKLHPTDQEILRLRTALAFYADPRKYNTFGIIHNDPLIVPVG